MIAVRLFTISAIVITLVLAATGCYTLLKHPATDPSTYQEVQTNECTSCHSDDELWYYHHSPEDRSYLGPRAEGWDFYYSVPWWYNSYWHYSPSSEAGATPLLTRPLRSATEKRRLDGSSDGFVGPPDVKSEGTVRVRHSGDGSDNDAHGAGDTKTKDDAKTRDVRPKTTKDKKNANDKEKPAG